MTTLSKDRKLFPGLLSEARDLAMRGQEGKLIINIPWGTEWKPFGLPRRRRPLQSVVLEPGTGDKIENDIRAFLSRRQWYVDRGTIHFSTMCPKAQSFIVAQAYHTVGVTYCMVPLARERPPSYRH